MLCIPSKKDYYFKVIVEKPASVPFCRVLLASAAFVRMHFLSRICISLQQDKNLPLYGIIFSIGSILSYSYYHNP
jgi:hypothetical protein